jgi:hypothetical protein
MTVNAQLDISRQALLADGPAEALPREEIEIGGVIAALSRVPTHYFSWSLPRVLLTAILTGGIWPLVSLHLRFRKWERVEKRQMESAGNWLLAHTGDENARTLIEIGRQPRWDVTSGLVLLCAGAAAFLLFEAGRRGGLSLMQDVAYNASLAQLPVLLYTLALTAGALFHLGAVNQHTAQMNEAAAAMSRIAQGRGLSKVKGPRLNFGVKTGSILFSIIGLCFGVLWALPLLLATAAQRQFLLRHDAKFRSRFAERLSEIVDLKLPSPSINRATWTWRKCEHERCSATMPRTSKFCPRCGRAVTGEAM